MCGNGEGGREGSTTRETNLFTSFSGRPISKAGMSERIQGSQLEGVTKSSRDGFRFRPTAPSSKKHHLFVVVTHVSAHRARMRRWRDAPRVASSRRSRPRGRRHVLVGKVGVALFLVLALLVAPPAVSSVSLDPKSLTPEQRRSVLARAFPDVFPGSRNRGAAGEGDTAAGGSGGSVTGGVPRIPRGRLGAVSECGVRDLQFEEWVRQPMAAPYDDETADESERSAKATDPNKPPFPIKLSSIFGRGRGVVTTKPIPAGETVFAVPLMKAMSTASARRSRIGNVLSTIGGNRTNDVSIENVLALHLLHELYVEHEKSAWWPYVSVLPKDTGSPLLWTPAQLAQLEGSNALGFRDAVLRGWLAQRNKLFPVLSQRYPYLFPEQHFGVKNWVWAMSIVWSRAAPVTVDNGERFERGNNGKSKSSRNRDADGSPKQTLLALVPLFDMVNHGWARGDGSGTRPHGNDASAVSVKFNQRTGLVTVTANDAFPGPGFEVRVNYGEKPSAILLLQYGFVPSHNPVDAVDVVPKVSKKDPLRKRKRQLLKEHGLSPTHRNFHFFEGKMDHDLLAATRVSVMTESELDNSTAVALAVAGSEVNPRNEAVVRATLLKAAFSLLTRYPTTLWQDLEIMGKFFELNPYDPVAGAESVAGVRMGTNTDRDRDKDETAHSSPPTHEYRTAVTLRIAEKKTLLGAARTLLSELGDDLVEKICAERYGTPSEEQACLDRASGKAFDFFEEPPVLGDDEGDDGGGDGGSGEHETREGEGERDEL